MSTDEAPILIVDDLPQTIPLLLKKLQEANLAHDLVRTPNQALRQLEAREENPYRLAIIDLYLPTDASRLRELDGFATDATDFNQGQVLGRWMASRYPNTEILYYASDPGFFNGTPPEHLYAKTDDKAIDKIVEIARKVCQKGKSA